MDNNEDVHCCPANWQLFPAADWPWTKTNTTK